MLRCFRPPVADDDFRSDSDSSSVQCTKPRRKKSRSETTHSRTRATQRLPAKSASLPASVDYHRARQPPSACDSSSGSESGDSVATTGYPDAAQYGAAAPAAAAAPPQQQLLPPRQASAACRQPLPRPSGDAQPIIDTRQPEVHDHLFTPSSFASRREPLSGNLRYRKIKDINRGSVGFVQLARDTVTGSAVAIKFVEREHPSLAAGLLLREIGNQRAATGHPHIIQLHEVFVTQHHVALVMEYANGGDLSQYIEHCMITEGGPLPEERARRLFQQLIVAVDFCHRLGIANRDIKLDNLLLQHPPNGGAPQLKLCDFGLSKDEAEGAANSSCGTPEYMAPEVLMGSTPYHGTAIDVWSAGVTLYTLRAGQFPFLKVEEEGGNPVERMANMLPRIVAADYQPLPDSVSPECADLIRRMLTADPARRITVPQILAHPWMTAGFGPLRRLNAGLLSLLGLSAHPLAATVAAAAHRGFVSPTDERMPNGFPVARPPRGPAVRNRSFMLDVEGCAPAAGAEAGARLGAGAASAPQQPGRGRACSMDLPSRPIGAAAANAAQLAVGGCRQSLAEIAGLLASAQAATAAAHRRAVRSLDLATGRARAAAAAARCQPAWQLERVDSICTPSM